MTHAPFPFSRDAGKTKVLVVDDSPTIRKLLKHILTSDSGIEVVGECGHPREVEGAIVALRPHVITLDIHLPDMNGVDLLKKYLPRFPVPTVVISSISMEEGPLVLNALEAGAVDYIQKPGAREVENVSSMIIAKVKSARTSRVVLGGRPVERRAVPRGEQAMDPSRLIAIGSSTGGTEALREVFSGLPKEIPPIVVVQHIPPVFSKAFADRMNGLFPFTVVEGKDGDAVEPGKVIIAPGGFQMALKRRGPGLVVSVTDAPPVNLHKPSADVLLESAAALVGSSAVGLILTGMGADGAKGLLAMKKAGCRTFAQDEATSVVYGMPQAAHKLGAVEELVPLPKIADVLIQACSPRKQRKAV